MCELQRFMPTLRSGRVIIYPVSDSNQPPPEAMANPQHQLFRDAFQQVTLDAEALFPGEAGESHRADYIKMHREALLKEHGFAPASPAASKTDIIKNFVATCNKYDSKVESVSEFFDRVERKFDVEGVSHADKISILDILLPNHFYLPYESEKSSEEQYTLYKQRALVKSKCTPIDMLYKFANLSFKSEENFEQIFSKCKYAISKCITLFPDLEDIDIMTWLFLLKSFPRHTRHQMSHECRTPQITDLPATLQRFAIQRNSSLGSLLYDQKPTSNSNSKQVFVKKENDSKLEKSAQSSETSSNQPKNSKDIPQCDYCKKRGHLDRDCFLKYPEKKKTKPATTVNNTFPQAKSSKCIEFILTGNINGTSCDNILLDSGAQIPAFHSSLCTDAEIVNDSLEISCMSKNNVIGNYKVAKLQVSTPIYEGLLEGICVPDLQYDCILPLLKDSSGSSKCLILNLSDENVHVLKTTCATLNDEVNVPSSSIESHVKSIPCSQDFSVAETTRLQSSSNNSAQLDSNNSNGDETVQQNSGNDGSDLPSGQRSSSNSNHGIKDATQRAAQENGMYINAACTSAVSNKEPCSSNSVSSRVSSELESIQAKIPKSLTFQFIKHSQETDPLCRKIRDELKVDNSYQLSSNVELISFDGVIYKVNHNSNNAFSLFIPKRLVPILLKHYHDDVGHMNSISTAKNISDHFYFENLYKEVENYVSKCPVCQRDTTARHHKPVPSDPIELTDVPFSHIALDYVTHFDTSHSGNSYLLTVIDVATRYATVVPLKTLTAEETLAKLKECHFYKFGFPAKITTDNGRQFTSHLFSTFCKDFNINHIKTSPMHPNSNGICERFNGTLSNMIKHSCQDDLRSWDEHVHKFAFNYNNTVRSGTKFSPHELVLTYIPHNLNDRTVPELSENLDLNNFVINKNLDAVDNRRLAKDNLIASQIANKSRTDKSAIARSLNVGDKVLFQNQSKNRAKMEPRWHGPYNVVECLSDKNYVIDINNQLRTYHIDLLKLYHENSESAIPVDALGSEDNSSINNVFSFEFDDDNLCVNSIAYLPVQEYRKNISVLQDCTNDNAKQSVKDLISKFPTLFSNESSTTNIMSHKITLTDTEPVKKLPYPVPLSFRETFKKELDKLLEDGIIEQSDSDYASPCIIVPKKEEGEIRIVVDFKALNTKLVKDREPISSSQAIFSALNKCKYFSTIDLKNGFWQIALDPQSRKYTAFITEFGLFQFKVLPFGLSNGPAVFSRMMRTLFNNVEHVFTFLDDILVATNSLEEHYSVLNNVFSILSNANLKVNLKKCHFCVESLNFLGQTLNFETISPQQSKIDSIVAFPLPGTKKNLQRFLGLCNYYRSYIKNYADLAHELYDLVKKNSPKRIIWTDKYINCFTNLKDALSCDIKLYHVNPDLPYVLQTDASAFAIGAVLGQRETPDGPVLPIQCVSKKLTETQQRYSTIEREAYAVVWAVEKLSFYLLGNHFIIETDHQPLSYLKSNSKSKDKLRRWEIMLSNFDFDIEYIKGEDNHMSDCLSRFL